MVHKTSTLEVAKITRKLLLFLLLSTFCVHCSTQASPLFFHASLFSAVWCQCVRLSFMSSNQLFGGFSTRFFSPSLFVSNVLFLLSIICLMFSFLMRSIKFKPCILLYMAICVTHIFCTFFCVYLISLGLSEHVKLLYRIHF